MTKEKIKNTLELSALVGIFALSLLSLTPAVYADEIVFKFKSPSFSGQGTSAHYLTIENQEYTRKMTIKEELKALQDQIERDKENTTLARFIRNLESRIYAQLSRQLVENLFGENPSTSGILELEGNSQVAFREIRRRPLILAANLHQLISLKKYHWKIFERLLSKVD